MLPNYYAATNIKMLQLVILPPFTSKKVILVIPRSRQNFTHFHIFVIFHNFILKSINCGKNRNLVKLISIEIPLPSPFSRKINHSTQTRKHTLYPTEEHHSDATRSMFPIMLKLPNTLLPKLSRCWIIYLPAYVRDFSPVKLSYYCVGTIGHGNLRNITHYHYHYQRSDGMSLSMRYIEPLCNPFVYNIHVTYK